MPLLTSAEAKAADLQRHGRGFDPGESPQPQRKREVSLAMTLDDADTLVKKRSTRNSISPDASPMMKDTEVQHEIHGLESSELPEPQRKRKTSLATAADGEASLSRRSIRLSLDGDEATVAPGE